MPQMDVAQLVRLPNGDQVVLGVVYNREVRIGLGTEDFMLIMIERERESSYGSPCDKLMDYTKDK